MILGGPMISYARPPSIALCLQQPPRALVIYPWTTSSGFSSPRLFQRSCNREDHFVKVQMPLWGYQLSFSYHLSPTISHIKECTSPTVTTVITLPINIGANICETWQTYARPEQTHGCQYVFMICNAFDFFPCPRQATWLCKVKGLPCQSVMQPPAQVTTGTNAI